MNRFEQDRNKKIYEIILVVKYISFLFCSIALFSKIDMIGKNWLKLNIMFFTFFILIFLTGPIYQLILHPINKTKVQRKPAFLDYTETAILLATYTGIILLTGGFKSHYKILYLFAIITGIMQFGMRFGFITSAAASTVIAIIDLSQYPAAGVNPFFQSDLVLIGIFFIITWLLGYYIKTENLYREILTNLATMDELTGLYNHRHFQTSMENHVKRAELAGEPLSLLLADLDYFKSYNDMYGHLAGDRLLIEVARIMEDTVGNKGMVFRYGGEEFAIILPGTGKNEALLTAEEIRKNIESTSFEGEENLPGGKVTISIGIATFPENAKSKSELFSRADEALYRAKFIGRNKVEIYYSVLDELREELDTEHLDLITSIKTLISIINAKDRYTFGHTERVVHYCKMIGKALNLPEKDMKTLQYGAYLHDIGKIEIPKEILNKKEKLTEEERNLIRQHPLIGADIVKPITSLQDAIPLIMHHHERLDGKGYPDGLDASQIPRLVRILTVADSFDAMTTSRPYKKRKTLDEAICELRRCSGTQFEGEIVEKFIEVIESNREYFKTLE